MSDKKIFVELSGFEAALIVQALKTYAEKVTSIDEGITRNNLPGMLEYRKRLNWLVKMCDRTQLTIIREIPDERVLILSQYQPKL